VVGKAYATALLFDYLFSYQEFNTEKVPGVAD
jgi:hypothetical protein